jgi:Sulfotransferase family
MIIGTDGLASGSRAAVKAPAPRPTGYRPVFILATPCSYATVTVAMLAGHPQIYGFPELGLFGAPTVARLLASQMPDANGEAARLRTDGRLYGVLRAIAQVHHASQGPEAIGCARRWLESRPGWSTTRLMDHLLGQVRPRVGLERSPGTVGSAQALEQCVGAYPDARFIHLTRHPAPAQRSMRELWSPSWIGHSTLSLTVAAASCWYRGNLRAARALEGIPAERWTRIHAEDLMREPARRLREILGWLGLTATDQVMERMLRTELWPFASTGPAQALPGGDPRLPRNPTLRLGAEPGIDGPDPAPGLPEPMRRQIADLAVYLGY